jgi:uncharacterized membrane protein YsdA (DUF1294 family)
MRYRLGYGAVAAIVALPLFLILHGRVDWPLYAVWLAALSAATFVVHGIDKLSAKLGSGRAPEALLDALALLGGFAGGWAGMFLFRHKTNYRKHAGIWLWLVLATLGHAVLAYVLFARA